MSKGPVFRRRWLRHRVGVVVLGGLLSVGAGRVSAATELTNNLRSVEIAGPSCRVQEFPTVAFLDSLRVELAGRWLSCCTLVDPAVALAGSDTLRVSLEIVPCAAEATAVHIVVRGTPDVTPEERQVSLADVAASARPRALALAAAELIRSFGHAPAKEVPAVSEKPMPPPLPPPVPAPMASRLTLGVEGKMRAVPTRKTVLWGGRVRLTLPLHMLYAQVDLGGDATSASTELGTVSLRSVSMGLGLGPRFAGRTFIFDLGPRFELGRAWIRGETSATNVRAGSGGGVVATLGLRAALEAPAGSRLRPGFAVETGGVLHGTRGESDGHTVVGITGYYLIGTVAFSFSL
jgi:hypothetical protein